MFQPPDREEKKLFLRPRASPSSSHQPSKASPPPQGPIGPGAYISELEARKTREQLEQIEKSPRASREFVKECVAKVLAVTGKKEGS